MNPALLQFLNTIEAQPGIAIGLVITPSGAGTFSLLKSRYKGQPFLSTHDVFDQEELSNRIADAISRMHLDNKETLIIDLGNMNGGWLQARQPDYLLRSLVDNSLEKPLVLKRVILVSKQKGFHLSPATMQHIKTHNVEL